MRIVGAAAVFARVAESADAYGSGPYGATRGGSSPLASSFALTSADLFQGQFEGSSYPAPFPFSGGLVREHCSHNLCHSATKPDAPDRVKVGCDRKGGSEGVGGLSMRIIRSIRSDLMSASAVATSPAQRRPGKKPFFSILTGCRRLTDLFFPGRFPSRCPASFHQLGEPPSPGRCDSTFFLG
jgi:hypothetical protein